MNAKACRTVAAPLAAEIIKSGARPWDPEHVTLTRDQLRDAIAVGVKAGWDRCYSKIVKGARR